MLIDKPFWCNLDRYGNDVSLIEAVSGKKVSYKELSNEIADIADALLGNRKKLILVPLNNKIEDIILYLGVLAAGHVALLYSNETSSVGLNNLATRYKPDFIFGPALERCELSEIPGRFARIAKHTGYMSNNREGLAPNELLTLLMSTSGSTGSGKLVRLSSRNVISNALQICEALQIKKQERAVTSLPLSYVYGLSLLHSHLAAGASLVVEERSIMEKKFWNSVRENRITSFAGVPWTYQMMRKIGIERTAVPEISRFTTAGAKMDAPTAEWITANLGDANVYHMYGQTEAAGRIAVLPPELAAGKVGSVGRSVPGGRIECAEDGSIIYYGPNVMLGYSDRLEDLCLGDQLQGRLDTGDLGYLDADGFLYISGRKSRISKIYGIRICMDEVRDILESSGIEAHVSQNQPDVVTIRYRATEDINIKRFTELLVSRFGIPKIALSFERVAEFQRLSSGKIAP